MAVVTYGAERHLRQNVRNFLVGLTFREAMRVRDEWDSEGRAGSVRHADEFIHAEYHDNSVRSGDSYPLPCTD